MQFDPQDINKLDDFSQSVSEKVKDHRLPVDPNAWDRIEKQLAPAKKRSLLLWPWLAAGVAAALLGLLFLLHPFSVSEKDIPIVEHQQTTQEHQPATENEAETAEENSTAVEEKPGSPSLSEPGLSPKQRKTVQPSIQNTKSNLITGYLRKQMESGSQTPVEKPTEELPKPTDNKPSSNEQIEKEQIKKSDSERMEETPVSPAKKPPRSQKPLLIARLGGGAGNSGFQFTGGAKYYNANPLGYYSDAAELNNNVSSSLKAADFTEINHAIPVSFSVMAEFPLNNTWSLQTGLMYTFLLSTFKKDDIATYRGVQHLHYLGIPVNIKANLWQNERLRVYALGGGALEKGLWSVYKQTITNATGATSDNEVRSSIDGVQFSTNVALGADYKITDNIRVFGEPNVVYYFNNNQPISARTENPLTFNLNAGIRISFGKPDDKK